MSNTGDKLRKKKSGCGLFSVVFRRPRGTTSASSIPTAANVQSILRIPSTPNSKRRHGNPDAATFLQRSDHPEKQKDRFIPRPAQNQPKSPPIYNQRQIPPLYNHNQAVTKGAANGQGRKVPQGGIGISGELEIMIADHHRSKGASGLVRASSSNVMLFGNLGNLRTGNSNSNSLAPNGKYPNSGMGNVVKKSNDEAGKMDPETLKSLGNEDYKNGKFEEALGLYDAAICIAPNKASYRSNKSAALSALGRLLEAIFECKEAIRIEPSYKKAHNRLATLYLRLGEAEKAMHHHKQAGAEADPDFIAKARNVEAHLNKCTEAKKQRDWNTLLTQTGITISAGADSAPQVFALKAEALLKLYRHQEADEVLTNSPNFEVDDCTKFFGAIVQAGLLVIRAQVGMVAGRLDDAVAAAQLAAQLDSNNREVNMVVRRTRAVAAARTNGNELYKASKYSEACVAYGGGLDHDPFNSVLLCNRATCRSKLGLFDNAIDDYTAALNSRPSYRKARIRRADCNAKLEKWEACIQDYEVLMKEPPEDEDVGRALKEAQIQLKRQQGREKT